MKLRLRLALLLCLVFSVGAFGQVQEPTLEDGFNDTYFYKIDAKQAFDVFKNLGQSPDSAIFSKPFYVQNNLDTLPLPYGNYLSITFSKNKLLYEYYPVMPWRIYSITNKHDLIIQFIDLHTDKPVELDAVVLNKKVLRYDAATKSYIIVNNKKTGILSVTGKGETYYLSVKDNHYRYPKHYNSTINGLLGKRPFYDAALIYRIFNRGLFDAYATITGWNYDNVLRETKSEVLAIGRKFSSRKLNEYYSPYFYFSKPKYKQGDTIKLKAYFLSQKTQLWCDKPLLVFLRKGDRDRYRYNDKLIFLGNATPKRKSAGYDYQFTMADSLHLDLDMGYSIDMKDADSNLVGEGFFKYEDYELQKAVFKINLADGEKQFKGNPFGIEFTAKDENGLPMPDTRASLVILSHHLSNIEPNELFVPDTLWSYTTTIKNGLEKIIIPDSIFPDADVEYSVEAVLQNSENEREDLDKDIKYYQEANNVKLGSFKDSIFVKQIVPNDKLIHIYAKDKFDNNILDTLLKAPCTIGLNTNAQTYYAEMDRDYDYDEDTEEQLTMSSEYAAISVNARRTLDSIFFTLDNDRKLPMIYHLYKDSKELKRGTNQDFPFAISANENSDVYIRSQYIWAGQTNEDKFRVIIPKNKVTLKVDQPEVITPGKETDISITATDYKNNPVKDVNLLAYSYTQKFGDESLPYMKPLGYRSKSYPADYSFELEYGNNVNTDTLNFPFWNAKMMLDTSWYYHFTYPGHYKLQYSHIRVADSITQVAPFVMDHGALQAVQYVLIDNVPVYFGFTDKRLPYSFKVDTNYHQIIIRTAKKLLVADSVKVKPYVKSIFSIDQNDPNIAVHAEPYPDTFTNEEIHNLQSYVMDINMPQGKREYAYLRTSNDSENCIDISGFYSKNHQTSFTVGPVYWRYWDFVFYKQYVRPFNYEPNYTYSFEEDLVKMKSNNLRNLLPSHLPDNVPDINDIVLTSKQLFQKFEDKIYGDRRRKSLHFIPTQINGQESLTLAYGSKYNNFNPINIILFKPGDLKHVNIYSGNTINMDHLPPGKYQMLLVNEAKIYLKTGIVEIKANGRNFYRLHDADTASVDSVYALNQFLDSLYLPATKASQATINKLLNDYIGKFNIGGRYTYFGTVLDERNETLLGVTVKLIGTTIGTYTDVDGNFQLEIPAGTTAPMLEISTIGYAPQTVKAVSGLVIKLMPSKNDLRDVIITTPYGPPISKEYYVGAADVVTAKKIENTPVQDITRAIEGAAPGVQVTNGTGAPGSGADIQIRGRGSLSAATAPLIVINGAPFDGDLSTIDPSIIASMNILKDAMATSLYGSRGSNGVILITIKQGVILPENIKLGLKEPPPAMTPDMMTSGMRHNFKDDAYWQPDLVTDENGKASFKITFPDDITNWQTIVIGVDDKKHTGQALGNIKSYKPVAASLYLPHFLLDGDTAMLVGKSVNYIPDTIPVTTAFYQNDSLKMEHKLKLGAYYSDTLLATAHGSDSVKLKYLLTKEDGYFDGEERTIPLERIGVKVAEGGFQALDMKDTSFTIYPTKRSDTLHLAATASLVDVVLDEIEVVRDYGYLCNEQMASKILALLSKQKMYALLHKDFSQKDKKYINELLAKIAKNQNEKHLWGWWENGGTVNWISNHVLHAIMESKALGYSCNVDMKPITDAYIFDLERDTVYTDIPMLQTLSESGLALNFEKYISRLERNKKLPFNDYLDLVLLRQKLHLPYKLDRLNNLKEEDIFGNIYWQDTAQYVYSNEILTTVKALKIIQNDSGNSIPKNKIINWLLQQRGSRGWRNTYESVQIIEAIAPYIPLRDTASLKPVLQFNGGIQEEIATFPYQKAMPLSTPLMIHKTGVAPVYFTWYYNKWDTSNTNLGKNFKIRSYFEAKQKTIDYLPAGQPVTMKVNVQVDKSAEYVMLEIPIPAGCSYQSKPQPYYNHEIHREYFENKVSIFCDALPKGNYTFNVELLPRYQGKYTLNPAKAELMYFPVFYGREMIKKVEIK